MAQNGQDMDNPSYYITIDMLGFNDDLPELRIEDGFFVLRVRNFQKFFLHANLGYKEIQDSGTIRREHA
jgi:hypothetical protein